MTVWRISVEQHDETVHDVLVDATDEATVAEFWDELSDRGFDCRDMLVDGLHIDDDTRLDDCSLRHGSRISAQVSGESLGDGCYLVAVAGPDTGAWAAITSEPLTVGRAASNGLAVHDQALSRTHFEASVVGGRIAIDDQGSTNGTVVEGDSIKGRAWASDGIYVEAGETTFGVIHVDPAAIAPKPPIVGASEPFQRRFREALEPLPQNLKHPTPPSADSETNRRSLISVLVPLITAGAMLGSLVDNKFMWLIALAPIVYVIDAVKRRKKQKLKAAKALAEYEEKRDRFLIELSGIRDEERSRDRWAATPAGTAALLTRVHHSRLWERSATDDDFTELAIGLCDRPSGLAVDGRPDDTPLPLDTQWAAVLRHSLIREGPLAVLGPMDRGRKLLRALLLDLAASHSPNDVKLWLLTNADRGAGGEWNDLRWLPHTYMGKSQNRIFATAPGRAAALSLLRSTINQRQASGQRDNASLPIHIVTIDCLGEVEPEELTDLVVDGAPVGVIGVLLDDAVTPEGTTAQVTLGRSVGAASFVSQSQPRADKVRVCEMTVASFAPAARALAPLRPAGSAREEIGGSEIIRLVDLIEAEVDVEGADRVVDRWSDGGASRIRVGGLGDLIIEIDIMRDGPHGLVGGTTRSGKTEFLKSLITSLAVSNHPNDLSIVIVDFKGGVDHELSARLPHVIDLSTNHNVDSFVRTVRLIEAELRRRQHEFKNVGAPNFDAYRAARQADPSLMPIPRLLVVIDEFSELLSSESGKANLSSLESVTRVGGGLGVHLLLVTQNFENQLPSQIAANAGLRICFRVQDAGHSKVVLNSAEAASIPKERIGRAFLRSHGGRIVEFQAARVAGPRPGKEVVTSPARARIAPFSTLADAPPDTAIDDVPAEDTDMYSIVEVIKEAAARTGWTTPVVPWPKDLPSDLTLNTLARVEMDWPVGLLDEPERQQQSPIGLEIFGPHTLLIGGTTARLDEVLRSVMIGGAIRRSPEVLHFYVIDQLGQGLTSMQELPHTGGVAERDEPLALRILRHVATEVGRRKSRLAELGMANVRELLSVSDRPIPDIVLVLHGADRLLMHGEAQPSPILSPLLGLLSESVGTGVRVLMTGPPSVAHHRLGSSIGHRFVFECPDSQEYSALGVRRDLQGILNGLGRAVDVASDHLMQFALVPSAADTPGTEVVRAVGQRLVEKWRDTEGSPLLPVAVRELPWPLPIRHVLDADPPAGVLQPVALSVDTETNELSWLDAEEDGPSFVVCGSAKSGRSSALLAAATLMVRHGWTALGLPLSRRSPLAGDRFPGTLVAAEDLNVEADSNRDVALFIDDAHRWSASVDGLRALLEGPGRRAVIVAGPTEFFGGRNDLLRELPSRCALILAPRSGLDASQFGVRRLSEEVLRDSRPGRGVLAVAGELVGAQVPFVG